MTTVIPGAKTVDQLDQNVEVGLLPPLTADKLSAINDVVPEGGGRRIWPA